MKCLLISLRTDLSVTIKREEEEIRTLLFRCNCQSLCRVTEGQSTFLSNKDKTFANLSCLASFVGDVWASKNNFTDADFIYTFCKEIRHFLTPPKAVSKISLQTVQTNSTFYSLLVEATSFTREWTHLFSLPTLPAAHTFFTMPACLLPPAISLKLIFDIDGTQQANIYQLRQHAASILFNIVLLSSWQNVTLDIPTAAATTTHAVCGTLPGILLSVDRFCQHNSITTVQDAVTNIIDRYLS